MSDEEDYCSSDDEDYVPSEGEAVSEEENSGEEENLEVLDPSAVKKEGEKRKRKKTKTVESRKRKGGIKLEGETVEEKEEESVSENKDLKVEIAREKEQKKEEAEKKKADDLWSSFMSDVGKGPPKKTTPAGSGLGSLGSISRPVISATSSSPSSRGLVKDSGKITVTKVYDFAGEAVSVTKEIDASSKEGKAELKKQEEDEKTDTRTASPQTTTLGVKRPGGGLGGLLDKINKKPKMGTLEKSKLDWDTFKKKEGIEDELALHNRGKQSFIERQNFLERTDLRQFEIEKNLRLTTSKR